MLDDEGANYLCCTVAILLLFAGNILLMDGKGDSTLLSSALCVTSPKIFCVGESRANVENFMVRPGRRDVMTRVPVLLSRLYPCFLLRGSAWFHVLLIT